MWSKVNFLFALSVFAWTQWWSTENQKRMYCRNEATWTNLKSNFTTTNNINQANELTVEKKTNETNFRSSSFNGFVIWVLWCAQMRTFFCVNKYNKLAELVSVSKLYRHDSFKKYLYHCAQFYQFLLWLFQVIS